MRLSHDERVALFHLATADQPTRPGDEMAREVLEDLTRRGLMADGWITQEGLREIGAPVH